MIHKETIRISPIIVDRTSGLNYFALALVFRELFCFSDGLDAMICLSCLEGELAYWLLLEGDAQGLAGLVDYGHEALLESIILPSSLQASGSLFLEGLELGELLFRGIGAFVEIVQVLATDSLDVEMSFFERSGTRDARAL
mmetsp:Transcript_5037/g.8557  ORF Transcript_5037/g.8557 Transcript_5037/m.8557 type:complete len:141 (-) Transcript_5037:141-563(-)